MIDKLIKAAGAVILIAIFFNLMGVTVDANGINVMRSEPVQTSRSIADCMDNFQACADNPPSFDMFGITLGE